MYRWQNCVCTDSSNLGRYAHWPFQVYPWYFSALPHAPQNWCAHTAQWDLLVSVFQLGVANGKPQYKIWDVGERKRSWICSLDSLPSCMSCLSLLNEGHNSSEVHFFSTHSLPRLWWSHSPVIPELLYYYWPWVLHHSCARPIFYHPYHLTMTYASSQDLD